MTVSPATSIHPFVIFIKALRSESFMALTINRKILGPQKAAWRRHLPLQGLVSLGEMYLNCVVFLSLRQTGSFREQREQDLINLALL